MLIDTHCHLNFEAFKDDLNLVVERMEKNGVNSAVCVGSNVFDSEIGLNLAKKYPGKIFCSVGIHPHKTDQQNTDSFDRQMEILKVLVQDAVVKAVGECGLDYTKAPPGEADREKDEQLLFFLKQIDLALNNNLPLIVHARKTFDDTYKILSRYQNITGVFHCYSGGKRDVGRVLELGFYFGVDGNLTYDDGLKNIYAGIPLEKIILETDSPFLAPIPFRKGRNEPGNVKIIAQTLADLKNIPFEEVCRITTQNAKSLFKI